MEQQRIPLKVTASRFVRTVRNFANSEVGGKAKLLFAGLFLLLCGLSALNVVNNYVGRNFITAIANRDTGGFIRQAFFYVGVFAALTIAAVVARFAEERLALLWRDYLTRRSIGRYLANGTYYRLDILEGLPNPDQRISEDIRAFTVTTLSFLIMAFNASLTIVTFSGVLWAINPLLFVVAVVYAACGSFLTIALGRPLIRLNYDQLDKEASFRSGLIDVRDNAEAIMLAHGEQRQHASLLGRLDDLVANYRRITAINRNVSFFTTGYNWLIQIIPALIVAPAFISGHIEFGVITQSGAAFAMLVGAFSLIVTQFQSISNFAAVVARLNSLLEAVGRMESIPESAVQIVEQEGGLAYEGLTLLSPSGAPLIENLSVSIGQGTSVLLSGTSLAPGIALFKATAGIPIAGHGRIIRPAASDIVFLQERPYMPPGTLRQSLVRPEDADRISADDILRVLRELDLERVVSEAGGLDKSSNDWDASLSITEQQLFALARVLLTAPHFVFLDRIETALTYTQLQQTLRLLAEHSITCISNGSDHDAHVLYGSVLEFGEAGRWNWTPQSA